MKILFLLLTLPLTFPSILNALTFSALESTQTYTAARLFNSSVTLRGNLTQIGDQTEDLLTIHSSSMTLINGTTIWANAPPLWLSGGLRMSDTNLISWGPTNNNSIEGSNAGNYLRFFTNNTEKFRIFPGGGVGFSSSTLGPSVIFTISTFTLVATSAGNVGIGTPSPNRPLDINISGDAYTRIDGGSAGILELRDRNGTTNNRSWQLIADSGRFDIVRSSDDFTASMATPLSFNSGNVSIATTTAVSRLHINSENASYGLFIDANAGFDPGIQLRPNGDTTARAFITANNTGNFSIEATSTMTFRVNNAERLRINFDGNMRIGQQSNCETITPGAVGELCAQNSGTCPIAISTSTAIGGFSCVSLTTP